MNVIRPGWEIEKNLGIIRLILNNLPGDQYPSPRPETCRLVRGRRNSGEIPSGLLERGELLSQGL